MDLELLPLVMVVGGMTLLYSAYMNRKPLGVIQAALSGKPLDEVEPIDSGAAGDTGLPPGVIPLDQLPPSKQPGDGLPGDPLLPKLPGNQGVAPILPGEKTPGGLAPGGGALSGAPVSYRPVNTNGRWV